MATAQAVTPGQGQTVRVAGVRVGDISSVDYEDGHAVVTMASTASSCPSTRTRRSCCVRRPASRTCSSSSTRAATTTPARTTTSSRTATRSRSPTRRRNVNLDQILAALDGDTRAYLRLLLVGGGRGPERPRQGPRQAARQPRADQPRPRAAQHARSRSARRTSPRLIHNMNMLFGRVGQDGRGDRSSWSRPRTVARRDRRARPRRAARRLGLLGPTLRTTRVALEKTDELATVLGPALNSLRPFARRLKPVNESLASLAQTTYQPTSRTTSGRSSATPASRSANLRPAAKNLVDGDAAPDHRRREAQQALQHGRLQPARRGGRRAPPAADEGYLYWLGWLGHVGNSTFSSQDAHGVYRHVYLVATCGTLKSIALSQPARAR